MDDRERYRRRFMREYKRRLKEGDSVTESLNEETLRALDEGIRSAASGRSYTWDEVKQYIREQRQAS